MADVVDGDRFAADVGVVRLTLGDDQVEQGGDAGTHQPGERRNAVETRDQRQDDGNQRRRNERRHRAETPRL